MKLEIRMSKTPFVIRTSGFFRISSFVIRVCFVIRHSSFVIGRSSFVICHLRFNRLFSSNQNPRNRGGHITGQQAADHGAHAEFGHVTAPVGSQRANAADLDGNAGEVGKAAEGVGCDDEAALINNGLGICEREITDELIEHDTLAQDLADGEAIFRRNPHQPREGPIDWQPHRGLVRIDSRESMA